MAKPKTAYVCSECGATALQWFGACPSCGAAGTLTRDHRPSAAGVREQPRRGTGGRRWPKSSRATWSASPPASASSTARSAAGWWRGRWRCSAAIRASASRRCCCRRLSTLSQPVLYVTGEESVEQVALRARRLGLDTAGVRIAAETQLERVLGALEAARPQHRGDRFDPDAVVGDAAVGARLGGAGARVRGAAHALRQARRHARCSSSATSRRRARSPGRACSSTSSTPCSTSRAIRTPLFAWCAR